MDMTEFSAKMHQLLEMEKNYTRIKSENLLFRQQNDDLRQQLVDRDVRHRRELADIFIRDVQKISLAETQINEWRVELEAMSYSIVRHQEHDMDTSNYCSSSYYDKEREQISDASDYRLGIINSIIAALEKSAGLEDQPLDE